jgi:hypothetical protein
MKFLPALKLRFSLRSRQLAPARTALRPTLPGGRR